MERLLIHALFALAVLAMLADDAWARCRGHRGRFRERERRPHLLHRNCC